MGTAAINMAYISALYNMLLQWIQLIEMILILSRLVHLGRNVRKPVFGGLRTTQAQTSLRIHAV